MQSAKEKASNAAASAKAGMGKTKAAMQEKGERMTTRDPLQKEMATDNKDVRIEVAERQKQEARGHNAAGRQAAGTFGSHPITGGYAGDAGQRVYPPGLGDTEETTGDIGSEDPNLAGGARSGYGSGNIF